MLSEHLERLRSEKEEENELLHEAEKKVTELTEEMQALKQETIGQLDAYKLQVLIATILNAKLYMSNLSMLCFSLLLS